MLDIDKNSLGWQPWLTPRQTFMIFEALLMYNVKEDDKIHYDKLLEWFKYEADIKMHLARGSYENIQ